jgi:hypothetical protein
VFHCLGLSIIEFDFDLSFEFDVCGFHFVFGSWGIMLMGWV